MNPEYYKSSANFEEKELKLISYENTGTTITAEFELPSGVVVVYVRDMGFNAEIQLNQSVLIPTVEIAELLKIIESGETCIML